MKIIDPKSNMDRISERASSINSKELHRYLWCRFSYSLIKDNYLKIIKPSGLAVYMTLRAYASKNEGIAFPSMMTIANKTKMSVNTVKKALVNLDKNRWIQIIKDKRNKQGHFENNRYILLQNDLIRIGQKNSFIKNPPRSKTGIGSTREP